MMFRRKKKADVPEEEPKEKSRRRPRPQREPLPTEGLASSVFLAYGIVLLNVLLVAAVGLLVLFFRGVVHYMTWIFAAGMIILFATGYYFIRRMRDEQRRLKEILALPEFAGRNVEISLLGGLAALRMGDKKRIGVSSLPPEALPALQLESSEGIRVRDLTELGRLLEKELITREEYELAKKEIFRNRQNILPEAAGTEGCVVDITPRSAEGERTSRSV